MLELIAVEYAVKTFTRDKQVTSIHLQIDNTCALAYLVNMGGDKKPRNDESLKIDMVISTKQGNNLHSGIYPLRIECDSGLGVQTKELKRMETRSQNISQNMQNNGQPDNRPICIPLKPPVTILNKLEERPQELGNKCVLPELVKNVPLRIPAVQSDRENLSQNIILSKQHDHCYTSLAFTDMVPSPFKNVNKKSTTSTSNQSPVNKPERGKSSTNSEPNTAPCSVACIRKGTESTGISEQATNLISKSRREGTRRNYRSAWTKFSSWCTQKQANPFHCSLDTILNYLAHLFSQKYEYRTINNHRSAISAFHENIEGYQVGMHPKVVVLLKGVSNQRPPKPRYTAVWDVEQVLLQLKKMSPYEKLNAKDSTLKLTMLLALTATTRSSELKTLDIRFMTQTNEEYKFQIGETVKHSKQGKIPPPIQFFPFLQDKDLCPYTALQHYLELTKTWRSSNNHSQLLLCHINPHGPAATPTIARWIKETLHMSGIDTNIFQAHSVRGAASSKGKTLGAPIKEILKMGNWKCESVWQKHYHKRIMSPPQHYQNTLLSAALNKDVLP